MTPTPPSKPNRVEILNHLHDISHEQGVSIPIDPGQAWNEGALFAYAHPLRTEAEAGDEAEAKRYADGIATGDPHYAEGCQDGFLAGRKGMVPASEVERLKQEWREQAVDLGRQTREMVAEAVKAERERCIEILKALPNKWLKGDVASMLFGSGQKAGTINPAPKETE